MSNNALGCSSRWVADCELWGVWCGISRTKAASVLASIWGSTSECAVAVMNMDVVLWKGDHLGAIRHLSWMVRCDLTNTTGMSHFKVFLHFFVFSRISALVFMPSWRNKSAGCFVQSSAVPPSRLLPSTHPLNPSSLQTCYVVSVNTCCYPLQSH